MKLVIAMVGTVTFALTATLVQTTATPTTGPTGLPPGWEQIDQRLVFLADRLAGVETSLDAVNKAVRQVGYKQSVKRDEADRYRKGNELMDRNAGGPVRWQEFYGKTAERFFYHPTDPNAINVNVTLNNPAKDPGTSPLPAHQRPPQFDYIYRANTDSQQRAEAEIAKLGGKIDALLERRRQLETQQEALWCMIAFRAVSAREFSTKPICHFVLKIGGSSPATKQKQDAAQAAAMFVRTADRALADAQANVEPDTAGAFGTLDHSISTAAQELKDRLASQQSLSLDVDDVNSGLGRFVAAAKRLSDVTKNLTEANRLAVEGDHAGDDLQKQKFRGTVQQSLFDCAANVGTSEDCLKALASEWNAVPDVSNSVVKMPGGDVPAASAAARTGALISDSGVQKPANPEQPGKAGDGGWISLFNGTSFKGWSLPQNVPLNVWAVQDGTIVGKAMGQKPLISRESYGAFELELDFKLDKGSATVWFLASKDPPMPAGMSLPNVVLDDPPPPGAAWHTGACVPMFETQQDLTRHGEWNRLRIVLNPDGKVEHQVNGETVCEYDVESDDWKRRIAHFRDVKAPTRPGYICLGAMQGLVYFRNIRIRQLPAGG